MKGKLEIVVTAPNMRPHPKEMSPLYPPHAGPAGIVFRGRGTERAEKKVGGKMGKKEGMKRGAGKNE